MECSIRAELRGLLFVFLFCGTASAADVTVHVKSFGTFRLEGLKLEERADQTTGVVGSVSQTVFEEQTDRIPLRIGAAFGATFTVEAPGQSTVRLRSVTLYPSPGLRNPVTGVTGSHDEAVMTYRVGELSSDWFLFYYDWELVPGVWVWQLWDGDKKLAEKSFTLAKP